ncbi:Anaerobic selenocysteine-containing dehydrogenase [Evansella caseinilytica]|uniref:Anaerobic selenocysteine-containing dehydrogenase n=1 Tax=Evansella caseinilytica TaxID=1503961 RepID=A0A1H3USH5_9BACI|nr:molybdopterin-dependent oxidoreductase [Evansella caseinilytica]SDZ65196.1 Anaerobic selenocysteine-containing dehydrogenase [Evansella caseinilytica]
MERNNSSNFSACPLNCWDACSFTIEVEEGSIVKVGGNKAHPITKGNICIRGRKLKDRTNSEQRITTPLKKVNGDWAAISWDQALEELANKLQEAKRLYGPTSVLHSHDYSNNGLLKAVDERFFRAFGGWTKVEGSLCWGAGIEAQIRDFGNSFAHAPEDVLNSRSIIIWGRNAARTNMHLYSYLTAAKAKGATLIVIDPMKNQLDRLADEFISVRPGSDGFLAAGIMKVILKNGWEAREFIEQATFGFEVLQSKLEAVTMEEIISFTGVSEITITKLAKVYTNGPTSTLLGLGMQRYKNGGNTIRLIDALGAISGNIGIPGGGVNYGLLPVGQAFDTDKLALREKDANIRTFTRMNQGEKILTETDPPVHVIIVSRGNPMTQLPNTNVTAAAFEKTDTVVVLDQFMTDTAEAANYFLPVTTVFEEEDIYYASMYHSYANYGSKIVEPAGEAKPELWIWTQLAKRLGFGEYFAFTVNEWLEMGTESLRKTGWSLEQLKKTGFLQLPVASVPWSESRFQTPSGKYEFVSTKALEAGEDGTIDITYPQEAMNASKSYPYHLLSLHPLRSNHSQHYHLLAGREQNIAEISVNIAREHRLRDGDSVLVKNDRGELKAVVRVEDGLHANTINIDEGRGQKFGGSVNLLTSNGEADMGKGSILYDCRVTIKKVQP